MRDTGVDREVSMPVNRRLVVFGGGGFVGGNLCTAALRDGWEVHIADTTAREGVPGAVWHALDIADAAGTRRLLAEIQPTAAVDLAAVADIDRAERERDLAWAVNVEAARTISAGCAEREIDCVYFSSDAVFAGTAESYGEEDPPAPVNWYGHTKVEGEKAVLAAHPKAAIVRISLALGFPVTGAGNSFFAALEAKLAEDLEIPCPSDEIRTPIDVLTLSQCVMELVSLRFSGVMHLGSTDHIDRLSLTRRAAALMGYPRARIVPQENPASQPGRAARHKNGKIRVTKAQGILRTPLPTVERAIRRAIEERM
jgi:dTDP-4-dehydrorhamnose reductase